MDEKLKKELIEEKLRFTRICVNRMLNSSNKEWSAEQKEFIDALFQNHEEWRKLKI